jgi:hypothetical protein
MIAKPAQPRVAVLLGIPRGVRFGADERKQEAAEAQQFTRTQQKGMEYSSMPPHSLEDESRIQ